jgi:hypothetical protein
MAYYITPFCLATARFDQLLPNAKQVIIIGICSFTFKKRLSFRHGLVKTVWPVSSCYSILFEPLFNRKNTKMEHFGLFRANAFFFCIGMIKIGYLCNLML